MTLYRTEEQCKKMFSLDDLEKRIVNLYDVPNSEENRLEMRKAIREIHGYLKSAQSVNDSNKARLTLNTSRGLLRIKYRDYVSLDFVPTPRS